MTGPHLMPDPMFAPVVITGREIYDAVMRVDTKVGTLTVQVQQILADQADLESRVRSLERSRWPLPSIAVLAAVAAVVVAVIH